MLASVAADTAESIQKMGVYETKGYNRGEQIDRMNKRAGAALGSSWCMSTVYYCYDVAAARLGVQNPLLRTASVSQQLRYAALKGSTMDVIPIRGVKGAAEGYTLRRGDIMIWKRTGGTARDIGRLWPGHTGIGLSQEGRYVRTIEGNTGLSFADGDGMCGKRRRTAEVLAVIRV